MNLESWDPLRKLEEFRRHSNHVFDELLADLPAPCEDEAPIAFQPDVDLVETPDEFRFYVSIPGMVEDDLLINVEGRCLTIRGERHAPYDVQRRGLAIREWRYGFFERQFELLNLIEESSIRAVYDSGVLTIVAQKLTPPAASEDSAEGTGGQS